MQRKPASLQCQSCFAESRGVVGRAVQSTVCSIIAMRRAKSRRVMLSVPSCGSAKKACFRACQRNPASLQCQSRFAESRGVVGRAVQSTVCSIIAMRRAKSRRVMLSVPSCGSAKKACFRACRVLQSRPVPCNVEQRRAINRIAPRSCHFLRVSCVASVSVAFCRVARSRAMLSNAVRSAQPRFSVSRVLQSRALS